MDHQKRLRENLSWYKLNFKETKLASTGGHALRFSYQQKPLSRAVMIVANGRTEYIEKYIDVLRDLQMDDISFVIYDHCGQGDSGRFLVDSEKGHIDRFDRYVSDLHLVVKNTREMFGSVPIYILSHSMGGTIGWLYCAEHSTMVHSLILLAPMFTIETGTGLPLFMVETIARVCCQAGRGERYVVTTGPFDSEMKFENNELTVDPERFAYNLFMTNSLPYAPLGGPTYRWLSEALSAMRKTRRVQGRIDCPVRFLVGSDDRVVGVDGIEQMAARVNGDLIVYENARHELLMESPQTRNRVLDAVRTVLQSK